MKIKININKLIVSLLYFSPFILLAGNLIRIPIPGIHGRATPVMLFEPFICLLFFLFIFKVLRQRALKFNVPVILNGHIAWVLLGIISLFISSIYFLIDPSYMVYGLQYSVRYILYMLYFLIFVNCYKYINAEKMLKSLFAAIFISAIFGLVVFVRFENSGNFFDYISKYIPIYFLDLDVHHKRVVSTFLDPNYYGHILAIALNCFIFIAYYTKKKMHVIAIMPVLLAFMLCFSRSSYINLCVSFIVSNILYLIVNKAKLPKSILAGFVVLCAAMTLFYDTIFNKIIVRFGDLFNPAGMDESAFHRYADWLVGLKVFLVNPVIGIGYNNYGNIANKVLDIQKAGSTMFGNDSSWILILATTGILGFLIFAGTYLYIIRFVYKIFLSAKTNAMRGLSLGFLGSLVGVAVSGANFYNLLFYPFYLLLFWILLGILYIYRLQEKNQVDSPVDKRYNEI